MMKIFSITTLIAAFCLAPISSQAQNHSTDRVLKYEPNWESLTKHQSPEWLLDAKFGIYAHWGLYSVAAYGNEWYAKSLYADNDQKIWDYHIKNFGHPSEFGYKDLVSGFKAEKFDPDQWAELIAYSGAKYAGLAVAHHDNFLLWHSKVNRWNVGEMGPKRDLYGDLVKSLRKKDMKVIATFHMMRGFDWMVPDSTNWDRAVKENWDAVNPEYSDFYWSSKHCKKEDFIDEWQRKVYEVIDNYQPDLLWFDGGDFSDKTVESAVMNSLAYYLNKESEWNHQFDVMNKFSTNKEFNFNKDFGTLTFEAGRDRDTIIPRPWIDDMMISKGGWGYLHGQKYKNANEICDGFIDRIARGGGLLLNLSPLPDGTLNEPQIKVLKEIGDFVNPNGEAIFNTRPWKVHAEGNYEKLRTSRTNTKMNRTNTFWRFNNMDGTDIRYTRSKDLKTLYAFVLAYPEDGKVILKSLNKTESKAFGGIKNITLVANGRRLDYTVSPDGMTISLPQNISKEEIAYAFKIEVKGKLKL
jgi:alpha-L-fucosidase